MDSVETRLALMERDVQVSTTMLSRLEITVEKIGEVAGDVAKILAVHDAKIEQVEQNNNELFKLAEARRSEMQEEVKEVNSSLEKLELKLSEDLLNTERKILDAIAKQRDEFKSEKERESEKRKELDGSTEKRIRALENWRWMLVGAGIVLGFILGKVPSITDSIFKASQLVQ